MPIGSAGSGDGLGLPCVAVLLTLDGPCATPRLALFGTHHGRVLNKGQRSAHAKAVSICPAVLDHDSRLIEVACPIDARIRFQRDAQGRPKLESAAKRKPR